MKHYHLQKPKLKLRPMLSLLLIGCLTLFSNLTASGQNVTISPSSGHLIAGYTYADEVGFENGWASLWRHNQLPLTLNVSDYPDVTSSGVLKDPAGDIRLDPDRNLYVIMGGEDVTTHMSFSLPKGYRFTGYRMVLLNDMNGKNYGGFDLQSINKRMYETNSSFDYENSLASTPTMSGTKSSDEYVIERTSKTKTDMGNNLYFYFWHETDGYYGATIKSIELYFTAEAPFQAVGVPGSPKEIITDGVNMVGTDFTTGKLDLGTIQPRTKNNKTYFSYDYLNVIDLTAQNWLYQEDDKVKTVTNGKLPETAGTGSIQVLQNDGQFYYALGNGTYYIETPTETKDQNGKTIPLAYRITGAQIKAHYGTEAGSSSVSYDINTGIISCEVQGWLSTTTYYLQADGTWGTQKTKWILTKTQRLQCGSSYLVVKQGTSLFNKTYYYASSTTDINEASVFTVSDGKVLWEGLYLYYYSSSQARFRTSNNNSATWTADKATVSNPAYTPSSFKLSLYGTSKSEVKSSADVSSSNTDPTLEVTGLNNDAVMFTIEGLTGDAKALITYELTMEQLNPFINTLDIVCHSKKADGLKISQQFTSNDFQVAGGTFHFYVPTAFADENNNCTFTFENLSSKYMDNTYGLGTNGNGRNYFVKSAYYNKFGDGQQYEATGDEPASDKVSTSMCGDKAFKYNNAADLEASGETASATTLEEYPYSEESYTEQGGKFTDNIEVRVNDEAKDCYLFIGDETRYNIAPTTAMEHRAYAFYLMQIDLQVKEYDAYCRMTKLYNATCYDGDQVKPMYGGAFEAYEHGYAGQEGHKIPSNQAFLSVSMMVDALKAAEKRDGFNADQVLYLDYTNLYSVMVESKENMADMKSKLNPNCLIFFPVNTIYTEDNYVTKTESGDFRACKNIVITDKQPFYSPYKITVPSENYASYKRKITTSQNGKVALATLMLPFSIELSNGEHSNGDNTTEFYQMKQDNCLSTESDTGGEGTNFKEKANFTKVDASSTTPNTPYMVKVVEVPSDENTSFEILQHGSDIAATTGMNEDYTFTGETASGTIGGNTYTFTNYASYAGKKQSKNIACFYFAKNKFYNSKNLKGEYLYLYPFRAYYGYNGSGAKDMDGFEVSFDEPTSIDELPVVIDNGLDIETKKGSLILTASRAMPVSIVAASGMLVWRAQVESGQQKTVTLPSGLYIVNGKKVIIR